MFCKFSVPWERIVAINKDNPRLASQAENVIRIIGDIEKTTALNFKTHKEKEVNNVSIIPSRQRRAESKWVR